MYLLVISRPNWEEMLNTSQKKYNSGLHIKSISNPYYKSLKLIMPLEKFNLIVFFMMVSGPW